LKDSPDSILSEDLENICHGIVPIWSRLDRSRLFLTGGTGFFGRWLLRSLRHARDHYGIDTQAVVLTRDPEAFEKAAPEIFYCDRFTFVRGDINNFEFPQESFDYIIHAAADSSDRILKNDPITMCKSIVNGIQRVLDLACQSPSARLLFVSSGASYGGAHPTREMIPEYWSGRPIDLLDIKRAYAETKRLSEMLCTVYGHQKNLHTTIARCFSFVGPGLPLNANYAIGNFIGDVLDGKQILIKGSGLEKRSYLYTSDLVVWLLTLLVQGQKSSVINVGSDNAYSIFEVADTVSRVLGGKGVEQSAEAKTACIQEGYVPSVEVAHDQYGLRQTVNLDEGVRRTAICMGWKAPFSN